MLRCGPRVACVRVVIACRFSRELPLRSAVVRLKYCHCCNCVLFSDMSSVIGHLYRYVIYDEAMCVKYLQERQLLPRNDDRNCSRIRDGVKCDGILKVCERKSRKRNSDGSFKKIVTFKCNKKGCQTYQSIRKENPFFTYTDLNGRCNSQLSLTEIIELVWFWVHRIPVNQVAQFTRRAKKTIVDWYDLCRDVVVDKYSKRTKMGGPGCVIQLYETPFQEKKKCLSKGGEAHSIGRDKGGGGDAAFAIRDKKEKQTVSLFTLCWWRDGCLEKRFFIVRNHDLASLLPIIQEEVEVGSTIYSGRLSADVYLNDYGYFDCKVDHRQHFIDPSVQAKTQTEEILWQITNSTCHIRSNNGYQLLSRHLTEEWWRSVHPNNDTIFDDYLKDMRTTFLST